MSGSVEVRLADLRDPADAAHVVALLDMYARDPMGDGRPLSDLVARQLPTRLAEQPGCRIMLAWHGDQPVGIAVCFAGFSTFRAAPLLNVHDLAVRPEFRGQGIGRALLEAVEQEARRLHCCRITLEVKSNNHRAQRSYRDYGFQSGSPEYYFWTKELM